MTVTVDGRGELGGYANYGGLAGDDRREMSTINVKLTLGDSTAEVELPNDTPFDDTAKLMAAIAEKVDADFDSKLASAGEALAFRINIGGDNHIDPAELKTMLGDAPCTLASITIDGYAALIFSELPAAAMPKVAVFTQLGDTVELSRIGQVEVPFNATGADLAKALTDAFSGDITLAYVQMPGPRGTWLRLVGAPLVGLGIPSESHPNPDRLADPDETF